jgi:hypothetical protein
VAFALSAKLGQVHPHRKTGVVGRIIALLFGAQWLVFQVMLRDWDRVEVAARFFLGNDFADLYDAAGYFVSGRSPYLNANFITPPPSLYLPVLLHHLSFWNALIVFRTIGFILVVAAILWLCRELHLNLLNSALMIAIALTYGPFYTVLVGGNLDALMLAFLVFACARKVAVRGIFLGLSIGTKLYSLLLIPVLLLRRRWKEAFWALGALAALLLPFLPYLPNAFSSVLHRASRLRLDSNESPAVLFILLFGQNRVWAWRSCYILLWGGTLMARLVADSRNIGDLESERFRALDYLPWMAAAPVLVFTYTGTILLPVIACLVRKNQDRSLYWEEWITVLGFLLTGFYSFVAHWAFSSLLPILGIANKNLDNILIAVAPLGISAILIGSSLAARRAFLRQPQHL